jgi:hypothetical protein
MSKVLKATISKGLLQFRLNIAIRISLINSSSLRNRIDSITVSLIVSGYANFI